MTLLFSSLPSVIGKCGHGLLLAEHESQPLHVVATDRGRLILTFCDDDQPALVSDTSPRSAARREGTQCANPATVPFQPKKAT